MSKTSQSPPPEPPAGFLGPAVGADCREAEAWLLGRVNYEQKPPPATSDHEGWHLAEFAATLAKMGHPERACPLIHLAGTKGKGSTTGLIRSMLTALGVGPVGAFTSPHIRRFRERIAVDGRALPEADFARLVAEVRPYFEAGAAEGMRTTFEALTAMAYLHFREAGCRCAVVETGLGGRLDCTNAAPSRLAVLTTIGYDHQHVLGNTIKQIAAEKAGIIKPGTALALVGPQEPRRRGAVERAARDAARKAGTELRILAEQDPPRLEAQAQPWGWQVDLESGPLRLRGLRLAAPGRHQLGNLRLALAAVEAFLQLEGGFIEPQALRRGIEEWRAAGRLEILREQPPVLVDAAHCPMSARSAVEACAEHFPGRSIVLVLGLLADKQPEAVLQALAATGRVEALFTHRPDSPRALEAEALARLGAAHFPRCEARPSLEQALETAREVQAAAPAPAPLLLATGSHYAIAPTRDFFA